MSVPMPKATDGAMPKRRYSAASRADMPLRLPIRLRRNAEFSRPSMGRSISVVKRNVRSVPTVPVPAVIGASCGCLLTWLITPPVEPRPNRIEAGPFSTSISLQVERIAVVAAEVAHAVEVEVVARVESAQRQTVALSAGLARGQADAGDIAQRVAHRGDALILHQLLRDHGDRLRGIEQRLRQLGQRRHGALVPALPVLCLHRDRRQLHGGLGGRRRRRGLGCRRRWPVRCRRRRRQECEAAEAPVRSGLRFCGFMRSPKMILILIRIRSNRSRAACQGG